MAKLYFRYSVMNSGKSLELLTKAYAFEERNLPFLVMKPDTDTRSPSTVISSRVKGLERECVAISGDTEIYELVEACNNIQEYNFSEKIKWILVDESQFLSESQVDELAAIVDDFDINVLCYGIRTDFKSKLFPGSQRLMELADSIEEIKSVCGCGKKAIVNARIDENGNIITDGEQVLIGGNEKYVPLCRSCWRKAIAEQREEETEY